MVEKLSGKVYFAYGFQEFALIFMTTLGVQYISYFLTDVALIPAAVVGTILLIGRVVDTVDVPIIGVLVEKSNLPWGKYRSWLFIAPPLIVLFNALMFTSFDVSMGIKIAYVSASYILGYVFVNITSTARFSLLPTFTNDQDERAILAGKRGQGAALGQLLCGAVIMPLIVFLGRGNEARGYLLTVLLFGVIAVAGLYWLAHLAKLYDLPGAAKGKKAVTVKEMVSSVATNKPLLLLILADTARQASIFVLTGLALYYFTYVVGNLMLFSLYMPITFGAAFIGNSVSQYISVKFDKKLTYLLGVGVWILGFVMIFLFAGSSASLFITFVAVAQFGNGLVNAAVPAFYSDTADYGEWKTGKSSRAVNMGLLIFPIKLGLTIGGSLAAYGLAMAGFVAGTTDPGIINSIRIMISLMPVIVGLFSILFMYFYPLNREKVATMQKELESRRVTV